MRLEVDIPEHHYNNIMSIDSMNLGRAPYKGIIMYAINAIKRGKVLEQEPWCAGCREYDQEKHCCHRWSKVIRDTVEEMKQESILDKIRAEIETKYGQGSICEYDSDYGLGWYQVGDIADILQIIDKYKSEQEET